MKNTVIIIKNKLDANSPTTPLENLRKVRESLQNGNQQRYECKSKCEYSVRMTKVIKNE